MQNPYLKTNEEGCLCPEQSLVNLLRILLLLERSVMIVAIDLISKITFVFSYIIIY